MTPAADIRVDCFRQIMIWPLQLYHHINHDTYGEAIEIDAATKLLEKSGWKWADESTNATKLKDLGWYGENHEYDYSEIVYFHSYVRDFLYGGEGKQPDQQSMRVLRRTDIQSLCIDVDQQRKVKLGVVRLEAYLFQTGVLLIVAELEEPKPQEESPEFLFSLKDAMDLQNVIRMVFPRRWNREGKPSETPLRAAWIDSKGELIKDSEQDFTTKSDFTEIVRNHAKLPAAKHLRYLLKDIPLYGEHHQSQYAIKQIEDQRIPSMTYLAVPDPREISEWDFARIAFFDSSGESSVGSYSDEFLKDWDKIYAYDRFWQRTPSTGYEKGILDHNNSMQTRWLCSGYGMAVVGAATDPFYRGQIAANFRHHYFRMGLIAHFQRASLLTFRDQLAVATEKSGDKFRDKVMKIQSTVTRFRARFWFREVSTQLQGQEFFAWWSDRLGNQAMFDQVTSDIAAAESQVRTQMEADEARHITNITEIGGAMAIVGFVIALVSLVVSIVTANWATSQTPLFVSVFCGVFPLAMFWFVKKAIVSLRKKHKTK